MSDYYYGALPVYWSYFGYGNSTDDYRVAITDNWMYTGIYEWTITRNSDTTNYAFQVFHDGRIAHNLVNEGTVPGVRPSFYLQPWVLYSGGNGTQENPYRLSVATDNTG